MYHNLTEKVLLGCFIYAHIYTYVLKSTEETSAFD